VLTLHEQREKSPRIRGTTLALTLQVIAFFAAAWRNKDVYYFAPVRFLLCFKKYFR